VAREILNRTSLQTRVKFPVTFDKRYDKKRKVRIFQGKVFMMDVALQIRQHLPRDPEPTSAIVDNYCHLWISPMQARIRLDRLSFHELFRN